MIFWFLNKVHYYLDHPPQWTDTTQSQLVWSFESQSRVKVKVVKWCRKKWFDHNLMYIYHKQCEILQKIHRNSSNIQFQWFPIDSLWKWSKRDQNYANANVFFLVLEIFPEVFRVWQQKADIQSFLKICNHKISFI